MENLVRLVAEYFTGVTERFDLQLLPHDVGSREATVSFSNGEVRLRIVCSAGALPSVIFGKWGGLTFGLHEVMGEQPPKIDDEVELLRVLAELTAQHGAEILSGDFSSFPRLRKARAIRQRRRNVASFGTSTGETRRFTHRPSLDELFADARNDGIRDCSDIPGCLGLQLQHR